MTLTLGGPGVACSSMTLRRLAAGELSADSAGRAAEHLAGCARCQATAREQEAERRALAAELPFEAFAAGVAERLATGSAARAARPTWRRALPLALAAAVALGVAVPLVGRLARDRSGLLPASDQTRLKGGATATLHLRERAGVRPLAPGEPIPPGGALRLALAPAGRRFAAAALLDEDGPVLLLSGPVATAPGSAFEWTGRRGALVVVFDDVPVDGAALLDRLARGGAAAAAPGGAAEVVVLPLGRGTP
jgi:anti-sigma factor RsiW